MGRNGNGKMRIEGQDIITGGKSRSRKPGITGIDNWENDFGNLPSYNNIEKILEFPGIDDMAGVLARAHFKNDRERQGAVRLFYKNRKFHDNDHQEMLRAHCAATLGDGGLGKILQTFAATNLLAPDMFRAALGMPKSHRPDEVHRGRSSDLRTEGIEKEDR